MSRQLPSNSSQAQDSSLSTLSSSSQSAALNAPGGGSGSSGFGTAGSSESDSSSESSSVSTPDNPQWQPYGSQHSGAETGQLPPGGHQAQLHPELLHMHRRLQKQQGGAGVGQLPQAPGGQQAQLHQQLLHMLQQQSAAGAPQPGPARAAYRDGAPQAGASGKVNEGAHTLRPAEATLAVVPAAGPAAHTCGNVQHPSPYVHTGMAPALPPPSSSGSRDYVRCRACSEDVATSRFSDHMRTRHPFGN